MIGIGSSALLSQQILIDSHLKYKEYIIKKKRENLEKKKNITDNKIPGKELIPINEEQNELLIKKVCRGRTKTRLTGGNHGRRQQKV